MSHPPPDFNLTKDQILKTHRRCIENVKSLLKSAKLLLTHGNEQYALGHYMYAVEEFGKSKLLLMHLTSYTIPTWIFGRSVSKNFSAHNTKIAEGFKNLPEECQFLSVGLRFIDNRSEKNREYKIGKNRKMSIPAFTTGCFIDTTRGNIIEFDFKTACFYIDWDDDNKMPSYELEVNRNQLDKIIILFEDTIEKL
jgi:AbiV family abortive infection protein